MKFRSLAPDRLAVFLFSCLAGLFVSALSLKADDFTIRAVETGGNVVISHEGSIDLTGFPSPSLASTFGSVINPTIGLIYMGADSATADRYTGVLPDGSTRTFGDGTLSNPDSAAGDFVGLVYDTRLVLPPGYMSGTMLGGSMTFEGATFESLGIEPTDFSFDTTGGGNTIYFEFVPHVPSVLSIFVEETGGNVVFTFSGSVDTTGAVDDVVVNPQTILSSAGAIIQAWQTTSDSIYLDMTPNQTFGTGAATVAGVGSGDNIGFFTVRLFLDSSYVSGDPLNTTLTFNGATYASLGIDHTGSPLTWTFTGSGDTMVMTIAPPAVVPAASISPDNSALLRKIKKLQKKAKKLKKKGKKAKAKKILKKVKKLKLQLAALG